jgi:hypothetical protein
MFIFWGWPSFVKDNCLNAGYPQSESTIFLDGYCVKGTEIVTVWKILEEAK